MQKRNHILYFAAGLLIAIMSTSCARDMSPALPPAAPQNSPLPEFLPDVNQGDMDRVRDDFNRPGPTAPPTPPRPAPPTPPHPSAPPTPPPQVSQPGYDLIRVRLFPLSAKDLPARDPFAVSEKLRVIELSNDLGFSLTGGQDSIPNVKTKTVKIDFEKNLISIDGGTLPLSGLAIVPSSTSSSSDVKAFIMSDSARLTSLKFKGSFVLDKDAENRWNLINHVGFNDYVASVTSSEIPAAWVEPSARSFEAVKAQAIAARSYALTSMITSRKKSNRKWDVLPSTKYQVYFGVRPHNTEFVRAAEETKKLVVCYDEKAALTAFSANSGGYTCSAQDCWGNEIPYLTAVADIDEVRKLPGGERQVDVSVSQLMSSLSRSINLESSPKLTGIEVAKLNESHRVRRVNVKLQSHTLELSDEQTTKFLFKSGFKLGRLLKIEKLNEERITFTTSGFGHGVGMSQWGAYALSRQGKTAAEILKHYYRNSEVISLEKK